VIAMMLLPAPASAAPSPATSVARFSVLNAAQRSRLLAIARDTWKSDGYSTGTTTAGPGRVHPDASVPRHSVAYPPHPSGATPLYRIADLTVDAVRRDGLADADPHKIDRPGVGWIHLDHGRRTARPSTHTDRRLAFASRATVCALDGGFILEAAELGNPREVGRPNDA
jgi:hypothetical protein